MVDPLVDQQLIIYPKPLAIVAGDIKCVGVIELRLHTTGPADDKIIGADGRVGGIGEPIEVNESIGPNECWLEAKANIGEGGVGEVRPISAEQAGAVADGGQIDETGAGNRAVHRTGLGGNCL